MIVLESVLILRESINRDREELPVLVGDDQAIWTVPANRLALTGLNFHELSGPVQIVPSAFRAIENPDAAGGQYR